MIKIYKEDEVYVLSKNLNTKAIFLLFFKGFLAYQDIEYTSKTGGFIGYENKIGEVNIFND